MINWRRVPPSIRSFAGELPQNSLVTAVARHATRSRLRTLGFHGVHDAEQFARLVAVVRAKYSVVGAQDVRAFVKSDKQLPRHAVWFTFDDGLASTLRAGEQLALGGVSATAFVCPSVIDSGGWLWFQAVQAALDHDLVHTGELPADGLSGLKAWADSDRRELVGVLEDRLEAAGVTPPETVTVGMLRTWVNQGHSLGNHTWDHPCLDTCTPDEQEIQIVRAHEALESWGFSPCFFAYPNGNWTDHAEHVLDRLGYTGSLLFDHRLTEQHAAPHRMSRLRIDSDASPRRALSILSGAHSMALRAVST